MIDPLMRLSKRSLQAFQRKLASPTPWEKFQKGNWGSDVAWSHIYRAGDHRAIWDHSFPSPELVGFIAAAALPVGTRVLDVGCGSGQDAIFLARHGFEVHGLDFSSEALDLARLRTCSTSVKWHHESILATPFESGYFDLITDRGCFHHIGGARRSQYAQEIARILKSGGVLFLRGSRRPDPPFFPIDTHTIAGAFDPILFDIGKDVPFYLVVDGGGLEATLVTIKRKH